MNEFYIGYLPKAPATLSRLVRKVIIVLASLAGAIVLVLILEQMPFAASLFEYGTVRSFDGVIQAQPYPILLVARPGEVAQEQRHSGYLLVAPGKHGADDLVAGFDGKPVRLQGQLIYRDGETMVEMVPGSIQATGSPMGPSEDIRDLGEVTLAGEIVDSKCYLGVMNPGRGKVHRDCAARCLSGGVPPLFISSDGRREQYLLVDVNGKALVHDALKEFIAEPITVHGESLLRGSTHMLKIDPETLRHP